MLHNDKVMEMSYNELDSRKGENDMRETPRPFDIYRHFKGKTYQIMTIAKDSETGEAMVVYQQLYAPYEAYVRPLDMFMSEVDKVKYPQVEQKYRFEKIQNAVFMQAVVEQDGAMPKSINEENQIPLHTIENVTKQEQTVSEETLQASAVEEENFELAPGLMEFLDADSYEEKLEILCRLHNTITDAMIDTMAVSLDIEVKEGDIEQRFNELKSCLLTMEHFECNRLR